MPIFHVETSRRPGRTQVRAIADELGALFGAAPGHVWVRIVPVEPALYAENQMPEPPDAVFVRVILRALPEQSVLAARAKTITEIFSRALSRPMDDVHVYFDPPAAGRIAFGGELVPSG